MLLRSCCCCYWCASSWKGKWNWKLVEVAVQLHMHSLHIMRRTVQTCTKRKKVRIFYTLCYVFAKNLCTPRRKSSGISVWCVQALVEDDDCICIWKKTDKHKIMFMTTLKSYNKQGEHTLNTHHPPSSTIVKKEHVLNELFKSQIEFITHLGTQVIHVLTIKNLNEE